MLRMIGFDGDDTLWHSEGYYRAANAEFVSIVGHYVDLAADRVQADMLATEQRNLTLFGYGAKGMTLSMVETAIAMTAALITTKDIQRLLDIGKQVLQHPVELLPGIRDAVTAVATDHDVVLITKGDLFHQERKIAQSGLSDLFPRIEIVSEKDVPTYQRLLKELQVTPTEFLMVGNSLRSDMAPVLSLGGWGVHMPYQVTWAHELVNDIAVNPQNMLTVDTPAAIPAAVKCLSQRAA